MFFCIKSSNLLKNTARNHFVLLSSKMSLVVIMSEKEISKIPVGISACLLGERVRYDGGHKQSRFCLNHLTEVFEFTSFCPEVAIGMSIPREPIRLVAPIESPRVVGTVTKDLDVTEPLQEYASKVAKDNAHLCGYIFMKNSPSCGLYSTKVYKGEHNLPGKHAGMYARTLRELLPLMPVEEEGRLNDAALRENFIAQVFAYHDWRNQVEHNPTPRGLVEFHSRYKYLIMAHGQLPYKKLGQMVAGSGKGDIHELSREYIKEFMFAIKRPANRKGHANTLFHILGYLREHVKGEVRQEIASSIDDYRNGTVNLAVPVTLLSHYLKFYGSDYINSQAYLQPYAKDLGLRNAI